MTNIGAQSVGKTLSGARRTLAKFSIAAAALASVSPAWAVPIPATVGTPATAGAYGFTFAVGTTSANGVITTDALGHATAITGSVNGTNTITGLSTYAGADNMLYSTAAWVSFGGLSFSTTSLGNFNFFNTGAGYYGLLNSLSNPNGYPDGFVATARIAAVPEPTSWALMLFGFSCAGVALRRGRKNLPLQSV